MNEEEIYHLARIIADHLKGRATPADIQVLEAWTNASPEHARLLRKFSSRAFLEQRHAAGQAWDDEKAYRLFLERKRRHLRRRGILRALAGMAAAVALLAGVILARQEMAPPPVIAAGESRATLTLGDGRQLLLGDRHRHDPLLRASGIEQDTTGGAITYPAASTGGGDDERDHRLEVPRRGEYRVILSDSTRVWLNSESRLVFPPRFAPGERRVYLEGEAYFEVREDAGSPFVVEVNRSTVRVLGTSFNVRGYPDEPRVVATLASGSVQLSAGGGPALVLLPGEQGSADPVTRAVEKRAVDARHYTSWRYGRFIFEGETLEEIMNTLRRWYDVRVFFRDEQVKRATFNGNLERYGDFNKILELLEMTGIARFEIQANDIYISK
jgi:ferric-dicitrate binding protein FerR (iron transport regulator)